MYLCVYVIFRAFSACKMIPSVKNNLLNSIWMPHFFLHDFPAWNFQYSWIRAAKWASLLSSWFFTNSFHPFTIDYAVSYRVVHISFIIKRFLHSVPSLLNIFVIKGYLILWNPFFFSFIVLFRWSSCFSFILLMWCTTFIAIVG